MSGSHHEAAAATHDEEAEQHAAQYDPTARKRRDACAASVIRAAGADACWTSVTNPTQEHLREAEKHRKMAADHRAASTALKDAEARACKSVPEEDRDTSPFDHTDDIASIEPIRDGVTVTFRAMRGMTAEWLQRVIDCHLARNSALGHDVPEMPNCPLVPRGVSARVEAAGRGFAVTIRGEDEAAAREIQARAQRLNVGASH